MSSSRKDPKYLNRPRIENSTTIEALTHPFRMLSSAEAAILPAEANSNTVIKRNRKRNRQFQQP